MCLAGLNLTLLHILSAGPAAEMTYYIWTEDQQIHEIHPFLLSQLHLAAFFSSSLLPQRLQGVDLLYIFFMHPDMLKGSSKRSMCKYYQSFFSFLPVADVDVVMSYLLIYSTAESAAL